MGVHRFRDPDLVEEFSAERFDVDVAEFHRYGVDWRPEGLTFSIDGAVGRRVRQSPAYPMQLMIGVFDFPAEATGAGEPVPELVVAQVTGHPSVP
jgi:beta-glucanase (GH16 family)